MTINLPSRNELISADAVWKRLHLRPGMVVTDLGCGALGHFVFSAALIVGSDGAVYAVDIDKTALHAIERRLLRDQLYQVKPIWSDIDIVGAARIPNAANDLTLIANNLYLSQDRNGLITEAIRLTKPGGRICIIEWKVGERAIGPASDARMSEEEVQQLFSSTECEYRERFDAGDEHYAIVFEKARVAEETKILSMSQPLILTQPV